MHFTSFFEIVGAIVVGEWLYTWLSAVQSVIIARLARRKYMDQLNNKMLERMPVGRANFIMEFTGNGRAN